jgi:ATP-dependent RNA helicase DeaD
MDRLNPARLMGLINENLPKGNVEIGKIEILKSFSFFEIEKNWEDKVLKGFRNVTFEGRTVIVEVTKTPKKGRGKRDNKSFNRGKKDYGNFSGSKKKRAKRF